MLTLSRVDRKKRPLLSIVVTSRNDKHNGSLPLRMHLFLDTLFYQLSKRNAQVELIIVEWNPPIKRDSLKNILKLNKKPKNCTLRIITVSHNIHARFKNSDKIELFQFIAKNVGIRRAKGRYILATNVDILFSDEIVQYLLSDLYVENTLIRVVRFDVPSTIPLTWSSPQVLAYCQKHRIRAFWPWGSDDSLPGKEEKPFWLAISQWWRKFRYSGVFTNACGDFTLMSNHDWKNLQGYPEYPYHGVKIDGLLCHAAVRNGIQQRILYPPYCIYHIDHPNSWFGQKVIFLQKNLRVKNIPFISTVEYNNHVRNIFQRPYPVKFNDSNWGLANENLSDFIL